MKKWRFSLALMVALASAGLAVCSREDESDAVEQARATTAPKIYPVSKPAPRTLSDAEIATTALRIQLLADSADRRLRQIRALSMIEKHALRRDANAAQIARARQLGIRPPVNLDAAVARHELVELPENTPLWSLHNLNFSVPFVTPSTEALLVEIGHRFQARLDSAQVPPFRMVITSVLRTPDKQAALRRVNSNASKIQSAHEFGTTVDIAYRRFAAPYEIASIDSDTIQTLSDSVLVKRAGLRSAELQAILGRVLLEMQREGKVMVMMERKQTVYHMTVARPLARPGA